MFYFNSVPRAYVCNTVIAFKKLRNEILLGSKKKKKERKKEKKEIKENLNLCNSMNGPGEYYAKWNKPGRERQVPYDFTIYGV